MAKVYYFGGLNCKHPRISRQKKKHCHSDKWTVLQQGCTVLGDGFGAMTIGGISFVEGGSVRQCHIEWATHTFRQGHTDTGP